MERHKYNSIYKWKKYGVICDDFDKLYNEHMSINNCQLCNINFNNEEKMKMRCLDHDHETGLYRQTVCNKCNLGFDRSKYKNNKTGYTNISFYSNQQRYVFKKNINGKRVQKYFKTLQEAIDFKNDLKTKQ